MKAYTDISQSKKLAEILPLESADMCYLSEESLVPKVIYNGMVFFNSEEEKLINSIYCWSLAALLEEIPEIINFEDDESDYVLEILKENGLYYLSYGNPLEHSRIEIEPQEYFVDACVEMIIKLHELKML